MYTRERNGSEALALAWPVSSAHANGQSEAASQPATHKYRMPLPLPQFTGTSNHRSLVSSPSRHHFLLSASGGARAASFPASQQHPATTSSSSALSGRARRRFFFQRRPPRAAFSFGPIHPYIANITYSRRRDGGPSVSFTPRRAWPDPARPSDGRRWHVQRRHQRRRVRVHGVLAGVPGLQRRARVRGRRGGRHGGRAGGPPARHAPHPPPAAARRGRTTPPRRAPLSPAPPTRHPPRRGPLRALPRHGRAARLRRLPGQSALLPRRRASVPSHAVTPRAIRTGGRVTDPRASDGRRGSFRYVFLFPLFVSKDCLLFSKRRSLSKMTFLFAPQKHMRYTTRYRSSLAIGRRHYLFLPCLSLCALANTSSQQAPEIDS